MQKLHVGAPASQIDIARRLGISQGTVHRALAGKAGVSASTREAVLALAGQLNYRRNSSAAALRGNRFGSIGLVARQPLDGIGRTLSRIITHCSEELRRRGANMIISLPPADLPQDILPRMLTDLCVDGLIVAGPLAPAIEAAVVNSGLPVAWIDSRPTGEPGSITIDERSSARIAASHLLADGRDVAFAMPAGPGTDAHYSLEQRLAGYRDALHAAGRDEEIVLACPRLGEAEFIGRLLARRCGPLGLLCYNHLLAQVALARIAAAGLCIPTDLSLACCDDDWIVALQGVTTMAFDEHAVSLTAVAWACGEPPANPQLSFIRRLECRSSSKQSGQLAKIPPPNQPPIDDLNPVR